MLAALLYLGAGVGLSLPRSLLPREAAGTREARLRPADAPRLLAIVLSGGMVGPALMLAGLERVSGVAGALLLNLEAPFTILLAMLVFREHLGSREGLGALLVVVAAAGLAYGPGAMRAEWTGVLAIAGACLAWAVDNNLTQGLSLRDPLAIVRVKTLGAGSCMLGIALAAGGRLPSPAVVASALAIGSASYGLSVLLDLYALRDLGAAREAALFATAPFAGAALAIPILGELPAPADYGAAVLMAAGVGLLLSARHAHVHTHEALEHDHLHVHDEHHRHDHEGPVTEPHAHLHHHEPIAHDHPHVSDLHHRHRHR